MLLEVNDLRYVILDQPPEAEVDRWARLCSIRKTCVLVDGDDLEWWKVRLPAAGLIMPFNSSYLNDVAGNIRDALTALDAPPYETLYVSFDPLSLDEAVGTRVGTALVNEGVGQTLPDLFFPNTYDQLETAISDLAKARQHGHMVELFSIRYGGGTSPGGTGYISFQPYLKGREHLQNEISDALEIVIAGRYFPETESRHAKHQPSLRLLHAKRGDRRGNPLAPAFGDVLNLVAQNRRAIDLITRVPPKPSKPEDHLGAFLKVAAESADERREALLQRLVGLDALRCVRDYGQQKKAGHYGKRAENVRGAFAATRDAAGGKNILLVDDILTSGATIVEAARTLLQAGARSVIACPIAVTQSVINYDPAHEFPCPSDDCEGRMQIRFAKGTDGAFWGCDRWKPKGAGCDQMMTFQAGLASANRLATRDAIVVWRDATF